MPAPSPRSEDLQIAPLPQLDDGRVQEFVSTVRGPVLRPADEGYDAARAIHNGLIDRRPDEQRCWRISPDVRPSFIPYDEKA
jgi:hypothetical protein